jgi:hypothetical protein
MSAPLPRRRRALWAFHHSSWDRLSAAIAHFQRDHTPAVRATTHALMREYIDALHPLIGRQAAFRYEASWQAFEEATDRSAQLNATMAARAALDETDTAMVDELERELVSAGEAFAWEQVVLKTALESAWDRDQKGEA